MTAAEASPYAAKPAVNPWLIAFVVSLAAFMEVLDTSIANVALPHMAGNLGASNEESTWVLTSYLVANAIVLPISGWLVSLFGRKRFFITCIVIFTASSLLCGIAPNLGILLFARILQGAGGGGLQPMAQAILADTFPPQKQGLAFAVYGVTALFAPSIGPTLGGWLTDNYSWRWIFYINLPVGILALFLVYRLIEDPPYMKQLKATRKKIDYIGFSLLALGVGALQILLDKGQEDDWLGSRFITTLVVIAVISLLTLIIYEWFVSDPVVDVKLFRNFNFATSCMMMFMVGAGSFASTVLMPQFLQTQLGYTAQTAGLVMSVASVLLLMLIPIVGRLVGRYPAKYLISFGWITLAGGLYLSVINLNTEISFRVAVWLRIAQYVPLGFIFIPATLSAYVGLPKEKNNAVAGLINFVRNIGSSVGTSLVVTIIARRSQYHQSVLTSEVGNHREAFQNAVNATAQRLVQGGMNFYDAQLQAVGRFYEALQRQAAALAYIDMYWILMIAAIVMFVLSFALKKNHPHAGERVSAH